MNPYRFLALALLATALSFGLVACGGGDETTAGGETAAETAAEMTTDDDTGAAADADAEPAKPAVETIVVRGGSPVGGVRKLEFDAGEQVRFRVRSDIADEVHVHGYDVGKEIPAGGTVTLSFPADIEGIFEVELHGSGAQVAELQVNP